MESQPLIGTDQPPLVSIRHTPFRPRNMVATVGIVFVRHEGEIRSIETGPLLRHPAHPCNTLAGHRRS
jgi:hypothetical protein